MCLNFVIQLFLSHLLVFSFSENHSPPEPSPEGIWQGIITQDEGGYRQKYNVKLSLEANGGELTGESYISTDDIFVRMEFRGKVVNGMFIKLEDERIIEHKIKPSMEWCMKSYQLVFKYKEDRIDGFWQGETSIGTCVPGKVHLSRYIPKA